MHKVVYAVLFLIILDVGFSYNISFDNISKIKEEPKKMWEISPYVEEVDGRLFFNPDYTIGWINKTNISSFYSSNLSNQEIKDYLSLARMKLKDAERDYNKCRELLFFREDNTAGIKIRKQVFYSLDENSLKKMYDKGLNPFIEKYFGVVIEKEIKKKRKNNKTYTYEEYYLKTSNRELEKLTFAYINSPLFYTKLADLFFISPDLFFTTLGIKMSYDACISYSNNLKDALTYLYQAVILSNKISNNEMENIVGVYKQLEYAGMCKDDYNGPGKGLCSELNTLLYSIERGLNNPYSNQKNENMYLEVGNLEEITKIISNSDIFYRYCEDKINESEEEYGRAIEYIKNGVLISEDKIKAAEAKIEEFENERLDNIDSIYLKGNLIYETKNIRERFLELKEKLRKAKTKKEEVELIINQKTKGWVADAYSNTREMLNYLVEVLESSETIKTNAEETINYIRSLDIQMIESAKTKGIDVGEEEELMKLGDHQKTLGDKFYYYKEAFVSLNYVLSLEKDTLEEYKIMLNYIPDLIKRAKEDEIDVKEEEVLFEFYSSIKDKEGALNGMRSIKNNIISKARLRYSYLEELRDKIYSYIRKANGRLDYMYDEIKSKEQGIIIEGFIDYGKGIGRLKELEEFYLKKLEEIEDMKAEFLNSGLEVHTRYNPSYGVTEKTKIKGIITIFNPSPVELKDVKVKIYVPFEIQTIGDYPVIEYKDCYATIRVKSIQPYETVMIDIEKDFIPIKLTRNIIQIYGKSGKTNIEEDLYLESFICTNKIKLDKEYKKVKSDELKLIGKRVLSGEIKQGYYYAKGERESEGGYEIKLTNTSIKELEGKWWEVKRYNIKTKRNYDFIELELDYDKVESENRVGLFDKRIRIYDVSQEANLIVYKNIESKNLEIEKLLNELNELQLTKEEAEELESIIEMNNSEEKLSLLMSLKEKVNERIESLKKIEKYKVELENQISKELKKIREGINCSTENHLDNLKRTYKEREVELGEINKMLESGVAKEVYAAKNLYEKRWVEKTHKSIISRIMKQFSETYKKYKNMGIKDKEIEDIINKINEGFDIFSIDPEDTKNICKLKKDIEEIENLLSEKEEHLYEIKKNKREEINNKISSIKNIFYEYKKQYKEINDGKENKELTNIEKEIKEIDKELLKEDINENYVENTYKNIKRKIENIKENMKSLSSSYYEEASLLYKTKKNNIDEKTREIIEKALNSVKDKIEEEQYGDAIRISKNIISNIKEGNKGKEEDKNFVILLLLMITIFIIYLKEKKSKKEIKFRRLKKIEQ